MLRDALTKALGKFLDRAERTNQSHNRALTGHRTDLRPSNPHRHAMYAPSTGEARRIAALEWAKRHPFDHAAERRSRHHRGGLL